MDPSRLQKHTIAKAAGSSTRCVELLSVRPATVASLRGLGCRVHEGLALQQVGCVMCGARAGRPAPLPQFAAGELRSADCPLSPRRRCEEVLIAAASSPNNACNAACTVRSRFRRTCSPHPTIRGHWCPHSHGQGTTRAVDGQSMSKPHFRIGSCGNDKLPAQQEVNA